MFLQNKSFNTAIFCIFCLLLIFGKAISRPLMAPAATSNSVTLTWTAPGDDGDSGSATAYDVRYSLNLISDANWDQATQVSGETTPLPAGSQESLDIINLTPSTTYYFAIKASDEVPNWSGLSNVVAKTTLPEDVPPDNIANLSTGTVTASSIALAWTAPGDDGSSGTASEYDIRYSANPITEVNWNAASQVSGESSPQPAGNSESMVVSNLNSSTLYYFAIKTADEVPNWSGLSNVVSATTDGNPTPPDPPLLVSPTNGASGLTQPIQLDWEVVGDADNYQIQVSDNVGFINPLKDSVTLLTDYNVSGLSESATCYWRVRASNSQGAGNWSAMRSFTTACNLPDSPTLIAPANMAVDIAIPVEFDWNDVSGATNYQIQIDDAPNFSTPLVSASSPNSDYTEASLSDGQMYYWRVRTYNDCDWSDWTSTSRFTAIDTIDYTPPAAIDDLSAESGAENGEILLGWTAPGDDGHNGIVSAYLIKYSKDYLDDNNWDTADLFEEFVTPEPSGEYQEIMLTDLDPGHSYYVGIKSFDENANGSTISNIASAEAGIEIILDVDDENTEPVSPPDGIALHSSRPILAVYNITSPGDNEYYFEVATDSFFVDLVALSPPIPQQGGDITRWPIDQKLPSGDLYYWRARANNFSYTELSSFSVEAAPHAYPNPFSFQTDENVTFRDIPEGANLILTSVSGFTVRQWDNITGDNLTWNGTDESGQPVGSGTYLWFVEGGENRGKIIVRR